MEIDAYIQTVMSRLEKGDSDHKGIADEVSGALRMAVVFDDDEAVKKMASLYIQVVKTWERHKEGQ